jgi:hypothetical protein
MNDTDKGGSTRYEVVRGGKVVGKYEDRESAKESVHAQKRNNPNTYVSVRDSINGDSEPID